MKKKNRLIWPQTSASFQYLVTMIGYYSLSRKEAPLLLALAQKIWVTHAEVYYCKCSNTIRTIHTVCIVYYCILPISAEFFKYCILLCTHIKAASNSDMYTISVKSTGLPNKCMVVRSSSSEPGLRSRGGCPWNKAVWAGLTDQACCKTSCCWILLRRCYENVSERESDTLLFFLCSTLSSSS